MSDLLDTLILTDFLDEVGILRAGGAAVFVGGAGYLAYRLADANLGTQFGLVAGWGVPAALVAWSMWNPARSRWTSDVAYGAYFAIRLAMFVMIFTTLLTLFQESFRVGSWVAKDWGDIAILVSLWVLQRMVRAWTSHSKNSARQRAQRPLLPTSKRV